jgi:4-amino-4-deoxy-L-arabinose transferase-like glycosyltransferase
MKNYHQMFFTLICVIYLALTFAYAILVPPWESPDEPAHYLYVAQLAERGRPPLDSGIRQRYSFCHDYPYISSNYEWYQPALGYLPAAAVYKALDLLVPHVLPRMIPPLNPSFCTDPSRYHNLFSHPDLKMFTVWQNIWGLLLIRLYLSSFGLAVIYAAYRIGYLLDKNSGWLGIAAAGWVGFLPQFTFVNANVRSDTLANAIAAFVFLLAVLMQTSKTQTNKLALGTGVLLGLGLISKYTFVYILPIGLLSVILVNLRFPRAWLKLLAWVMLPAILIVVAYYLTFAEARAALIYTTTTTLKIRPNALTWDYLQRIWQPLFIDLFFARFGWANIAVPATLSRVAFALWCIGTAVTLAQAWQQRHTENRLPLKIITLLSMGVILAIIGVVRFNLSQFQPQGRLLFPALVPWTLLAFWGWWQVLSTRGRMLITIVALAFMLAFNLYALFFVLVPAYYR